MQNKYKKDLSKKLAILIKKKFTESILVSEVFTANGLICDFDMPVPIDPQIFQMIREEIGKENIACAYELSSYSGVYQDGDSSNKMLQRLYVNAFENEKDLTAYHERLEQAAEHDHKKIASQMSLYSSSDEVGAGLILWHPKGAMVRCLLEEFGQKAHILNGYQWVYTPHIGKASLWETSGHLDFYKDSMYRSMLIDGEAYYLKPMNCPFHINIFNSGQHSYRDLPVRLAEYGTVYRYELSGALNGMTRVRGFTQDDAHIICTEEQIEKEVENALLFSLYVLRSFGFKDFKIYLSTRPKVKSIGSQDDWDTATKVLEKAIRLTGLSYDIDDGGGAFYGPKIDIKLKDLFDREWQCSTIQFDFNLPQRFKMSYAGKDGNAHTPYMIHRALFGSIERFVALLIEHYKGNFPLWLAPVQFAIVPVNQSHLAYCNKLELQFKRQGYRIKADYKDCHMREKIKKFELEKIPFIFIVGDKEVQQNAFSVRSKKKGMLGVMGMDEFLTFIQQDIDKGVPKYIFED